MRNFFILIAAALAVACTPGTVTQGPLTVKPNVEARAKPAYGSIYSAGSHRPLFEDRRARFAGDILTIVIAENTNAKKASGSSADKSGEVKSNVGMFMSKYAAKMDFDADSNVSYEDKSAANASNAFNGSVTVTVTDVLPNGYLVIGGEKQIALDKGTEFVRISGVVNPDQLGAGNVISSAKVADARIEYRSNSRVDAAVVANILSRFFFSFIPL